ncbi:acyl-CoA dehydrogenase C-terminal domain-containing protein [Marinobacter halophilus]|uniref:3-methylmercaptopropionyl-CoA dehydrogenase n=1 Tax=Marinobacter halophilus TaxID=1323740 RepID=A0A2T1KKU0_9GAMM|nr:acyl-CoA dehydrogenase C-terminal domain-containing protein [Marinobacter halophilus]PSF10343.1 acyl-CoA dehydrogenase [Marinobacter halophilus]GGC69919.1 acyl-CoA dehydrogenase [Marinobacter halophilus]
MQYQAPANDLRFLLFDVLGADKLHELEKYADATPDLISAVIDEAGKLAAEVIQPTNQVGDRQGCTYDPETKNVKTPDGFKEAYKKFVEGGWTALDAPIEFGGQGLPHTLKFVVDEMVCSTNLSLGMYPGLTHGAISALFEHGSEELKQTYLEKLISGEWTGTMCLTEPQCGTDLGLIRTKATPNDDGSYAIEGTKIWITGGEHDLVDNIVHLVLAKLPGAPDTTKGISLFVVPKVLPDSGERNPAFCGGLEHKMGIKGSATCVMNFEGAKGWLVGEPNDGMRAMFTMMNEARLMVGMQGLGLAEMAYQESLAFAKERLQSRSLSGPKNPNGPADPIIVHPDVRRMLMRQKVLNEGMRAMALFTGHQLDLSVAHGDESVRENADDLVQLLTPVVKAFLTDEGYNNANWGQQVLGGSGFTQDWPLEQLVRDGRIARIYEGTNGIQAMDLVGRKLSLKGGQLVRALFTELTGFLKDNPDAPYREELKGAIKSLEQATMWLAQNAPKDPEQAGAAASPYLRVMALTVIGYLWSRMAAVASRQLDAGEGNKPLLESKVASARYYFEKLLPEVDWLVKDIQSGKDSLMAMNDEHWVA